MRSPATPLGLAQRWASATAALDTFAFTYDPRGSRSTLTKPNGNVTALAYHQDGLVRTMVERTSADKGSQVVASHSLKYHPDGDRLVYIQKHKYLLFPKNPSPLLL